MRQEEAQIQAIKKPPDGRLKTGRCDVDASNDTKLTGWTTNL
uniref:Uncharacterized protein n=2 Tax=unclassified Caudoviricetes TaxID=2788787 RepID=A0A8S5V6E8_9CAUD|nr:MAG TPA: hypothetical protein [Siphoviridae sp. ctMBu2]DAG02292.1 MAG TPA: hypothetical protein [Myoviridae sp. ctRci5]DAK39496.1 MAG TPA: hypothetical protein [Caudoviricetes sp.]DAN26630.1 MAG TPA: hypothetical protein [Caudoviricetes sp.]DAU29619.1 MAG TPA: hypothetical protein [Caudoviricetes sp.]